MAQSARHTPTPCRWATKTTPSHGQSRATYEQSMFGGQRFAEPLQRLHRLKNVWGDVLVADNLKQEHQDP